MTLAEQLNNQNKEPNPNEKGIFLTARIPSLNER
jgi:hypothetical protein